MFRYDIFPNSYTYIVPGSYYFYGALSNGLVAQWYHLFTPISFFIIMISIVNEQLTSVFKGKYRHLQIAAPMIFVLLFSVFSSATFISGNMYISACLIGLSMICLKEKDYKTPALLFLVTQFYSSTGALLSFALVVSMFLYLIAYENLIKVLKLAPLYVISLFSIPLLMFSFAGKEYGSVNPIWAYSFIACFAGVLALLFIVNLYYHKARIKPQFFEFGFMQTKWFSSLWMKYLILFISCASMLIIIIYYQAIHFQLFVYSMIPFYLLLALIFPLVIFNFIKEYNKETNINFLLMMNICLVSLTLIFIWVFDVQNNSIWRVMMVLPTVGIGESTISYTILWALNISITIPYFNALDWTFVNKLNLFKSSKQAVIGMSATIIVSSFVPITIVGINPALSNYTYSTYNANIYKNINLFESSDINKMLKLGKFTANSGLNFVFDNYASAYIAIPQENNYSYRFYASIFESKGFESVSTDTRNNPLGALGFYKSRLISREWKNQIIVNQTVAEFGDYLDAYINSEKWYQITDVIFLDKKSEYYKYISFENTPYHDLNIFNDIAVVANDHVILEKIQNNI